MKLSNVPTGPGNEKVCGSFARFFTLALAFVALLIPVCHAHDRGARALLVSDEGVKAVIASPSSSLETNNVHSRFENNVDNGNMAPDCNTDTASAPYSTLSVEDITQTIGSNSGTAASSEEPVITVTETATVKPASLATSAFLTANTTTSYLSVTSESGATSAIPYFRNSTTIDPVLTSAPTSSSTSAPVTSLSLTWAQETSTDDGQCHPLTTVTIVVTVTPSSALARTSTVTETTGTTTVFATVGGSSVPAEQVSSTTTTTFTSVKTITVTLASKTSAVPVPNIPTSTVTDSIGMTTATSALSSSCTNMTMSSDSSSSMEIVATFSLSASLTSGMSTGCTTSNTVIVMQNSTTTVYAQAGLQTSQQYSLGMLGTASSGFATVTSGISPLHSANGSYTGPSASTSSPSVVTSGGDKAEEQVGSKHIAIIAALAMAVLL